MPILRGDVSIVMLSTGGKLDELACAVYIDCCADRGVEAEDNGEAECRDADDRLVKRRCNEGFFILRVRIDEADAGPCKWGVDPPKESPGIDGRRVGNMAELSAEGKCISPPIVGLVVDR
jgi:hypothetical protein